MKRQTIALLFYGWLLLPAGCSGDKVVETISPDSQTKITFHLKQGAACYTVQHKGKIIIEQSPLALDVNPGGKWGKNLKLEKVTNKPIDEKYDLLVGKSDSAHNHCRENTLRIAETAGAERRIDLVIRAYNDGVAFRYRFPQQKAFKTFEILSEKTAFRFPGNHKCWALRLGSFTTSYEKEFSPVGIAAIRPDDIVGLPLTIRFRDGPAVAISEANLTDYAGMYLCGSDEHENTLLSKLSPLPHDSTLCVKASTPFVSPWRVVMIGDTPGDLIESNIILNLNAPSAIKDPSWIQAGTCAWDWWSGQVVDDPSIKSGMNDATIKHYIDFAAENGFEYMLIDAGWAARTEDGRRDITRCNPHISVPGLVQYANAKNVDILIWMHWTSVKQQMNEAFALYEQWGVRGVKIDFMDRDDQEMVRFYHEMIQTAARHHLMIDFHGAYKPTGVRRTWPNVMTREGILGLEYLKWSDRAGAEHNVTAPFTRMPAGPMDYTPGGFRNVTKAEFKAQRTNPMVPTTRCHQLALFVVVESPLQMAADAPANYRHQPGLDFLRRVPATWDDTRVIAGEIGDYIAIARRSGEEWFIGGLTDEKKRMLDIPLSFMGDGAHRAEIWADAPDSEQNPTHIARSEKTVTNKDTLKADMAASGGLAVCLVPVE